MSGFVGRATPALQALKAYDPGHDLPKLRRARAAGDLVELGSNENAWGPSSKVLDALRGAAIEDVFRYPDPMGLVLRRQLAELHQVSIDEIVLGNGSHEILMQLAQIFCGPGDELVHSRFGFAVYPISARAVGATPIAAEPYARDAPMSLGHDLEALFAAITSRCRLLCMANPNNPTGTWVTRAQLVAFMERVPRHLPVVIDEAYIEFADAPGLESALGLRNRFPNLVVTRTFSKAYGLAGLRIGYAIAHPEVIDLVNRLRESFNANGLALLAAEVALRDRAHLRRVVDYTQSERERVAEVLRSRGLKVLPSQGNFLLIDFAREAAPIEAVLLREGVVVRPMIAYGLPEFLRVTIATAAENDRFLEALVAVKGLLS
jgi:histidinol-phosphate aminotransferase